ncbi:hypothetical protein [Streptomyces canus]|uniref:hypothetical protein n=1 Tax=Streptomyces canus TaxID=58343 RepID=UPI0033ABFAC6
MTFDSVSCADAVQAYEENGVIVYERVATSPYSARILLSLGLEGGGARVSSALPHT